MKTSESVELKTLNITYNGNVLVLGSCIGKTSMDRGYFYSEKNNYLFPLFDEAFYPEEKIFTKLRDEYIDNIHNRDAIREELTQRLNLNNLALGDVIHHCFNGTNSKDNSIKRNGIIKYNPHLYDYLTDNVTTIIINGESVIKFIKWYLRDKCGMATRQASDFVNQKRSDGKLIVLLSSSGANNGKADERKKQWSATLRRVCKK